MLEFGSPEWLWGMLVIPVTWLIAHGKQVLATRRARVVALITRSAIFACVLFALADARWSVIEDGTAVLFLVDNSASVQIDGISTAQEFVDAAMQSNPSRPVSVATLLPNPSIHRSFFLPKWDIESMELCPREQTALASGIDWSGLAIHPDMPTRVVLLTDGLVSDAPATLLALDRSRQRGIPVDLVALQPNRGQELELGDVPLPSRIEPGRPFDLPLHIRSSVAQEVSIKIFQNDLLVREAAQAVNPGESEVIIDALVPEPGAGSWRVEVAGTADTRMENNAITRFAAATGETRVLVIDPDPNTLSSAIRALEQGGMTVETRRPAEFPSSLDGLANFDLVVLSNTSASMLEAYKIGLLTEWVSDVGGGLLVTGGPNAYAAGGYFGTPLASLIPVITEYIDQAELSVAALYVSLDRSGSMSAPVAGTTKMALANAGAVRAMELLDRTDLFGVAAVDTEVHPILSLGPISDRTTAARIIQSITSGGGGIYVFTALTAGYRQLVSAKAMLKHLILFSDAADAEEQTAPAGTGAMTSALDVASAMLAARITVSVVALGVESDRDTSFLRTLAARGGGRFYLTSDATTLPRIFAEETLRATQNSLVELPFLPVVGDDDPSLAGIAWADAPDLLGHNAVQARSEAQNLLLTNAGTPLQATWRRGLGRVTAFTSDINGRWSRDWLDWSGFRQWLLQTLRSLAPVSRPGEVTVRTTLNESQLVVEINATNPDGSYRSGREPQVALSEGGSAGKSVVAQPVGPGMYQAIFDLPIGKSGLVSVVVDDEATLAAWHRDPDGEAWVLRDAGAFLNEAVERGAGQLNPAPDAVFRPTGHAISSAVSLVPWLIVLAIVLWPVDIWLRRRDWAQGILSLPR